VQSPAAVNAQSTLTAGFVTAAFVTNSADALSQPARPGASHTCDLEHTNNDVWKTALNCCDEKARCPKTVKYPRCSALALIPAAVLLPIFLIAHRR
jgi:hypothetical protein